jgi:hypothetical protein
MYLSVTGVNIQTLYRILARLFSAAVKTETHSRRPAETTHLSCQTGFIIGHALPFVTQH